MTRKRFWDDPYQTTLMTTVSAVAGGEVMLAETILYAFSGGQERDRGTIGGYVVEDARKAGRDIWYTLEPAHTLRSGDPVQVELDWARRCRLMRLHFAAEIVLVLAYRMFPGIEKIGAHIAEDRARIDFTWPESIAPALPAIAQEARTLITADLPITSAFSDEAGERRSEVVCRPPPYFLEDLVPGATFRTGALSVDADAITAFAAQFDPQPFHLDPAAAEASVFGALVASGWHTAALTVRLLVGGELQLAGGLVGLGVTDLRWPRAVLPGDTLSAVVEVVEVQPSTSRPNRGTALLRTTTSNQRGEPVLIMISKQLVPRRTGGAQTDAHDGNH